MATEQQVPKLVAALVEHQRAFLALSTEEAQRVIDTPKDAIGLFVSAVKNRVEQPTEPNPDFIIRIDRSICPVYSDWVKEVIHPELENTGPSEYNLATDLVQWCHEKQKGKKTCEGRVIYEHLKENKMLDSCAGLADLVEIQKKGIKVFRQLFSSKAIFGWKSVVRDSRGFLLVPCLYEDGDEVALYWRWLGRGWYRSSPALRFAK